MLGLQFHITNRTLNNIMEITKLAEAIASKKISPAAYRRITKESLATSLAYRGYNAFYIQQQMRHRDLRTTLIYVHITKKKLRESMDKYVPEF